MPALRQALSVVRNSMKPLLFSIITVLVACNDSVDVNSPSSAETTNYSQKKDSTRFHSYKHDLFVNLKGQLAYKTTDNSDPSNPRDKFFTTINIDSLDFDQEKELNKVIDTSTFVHVGDLYYKDKNHVYYHHQMMDGGTFFIVREADPGNFQVLDSSYYGKDNKYVFCRGGLLEEADSKTFRVISQDPGIYFWHAKDKNRTYEGCNSKVQAIAKRLN